MSVSVIKQQTNKLISHFHAGQIETSGLIVPILISD